VIHASSVFRDFIKYLIQTKLQTEIINENKNIKTKIKTSKFLKRFVEEKNTYSTLKGAQEYQMIQVANDIINILSQELKDQFEFILTHLKL
jgi:hypothetical protein